MGLPPAGALLTTPTKCKHSYGCAITIRHRNRAMSFPTSTPHCDSWLLPRARWEGVLCVHSADVTPSSGDPAGHTHQMQALKRVRHHHKTSELSDVVSNQYPTLWCLAAPEGMMGRLSVGAWRGWDSLQRGPCWPHPPNAGTHTGPPSPSDIGIERCLFQPVPHTVMHDCTRGKDGKALRG